MNPEEHLIAGPSDRDVDYWPFDSQCLVCRSVDAQFRRVKWIRGVDAVSLIAGDRGEDDGALAYDRLHTTCASSYRSRSAGLGAYPLFFRALSFAPF
jgi:hypothetical protein